MVLARFPRAQLLSSDTEYRRSTAFLVYAMGIGVVPTGRVAMRDPPNQGRPHVSPGSGLANATIMQSKHNVLDPLLEPKHV